MLMNFSETYLKENAHHVAMIYMKKQIVIQTCVTNAITQQDN